MATTTTTTLTELVESSLVDETIVAYAFGWAPIAGFSYFMDYTMKPTATAEVSRWILDTHQDVSSEGAEITNETLETTSVTVAASKVGIRRDLSEESFEDTILGEAGLFDFIVKDSAKLIAKAIDEDLAAQFVNASNSVGSSGSDLTLAIMVEAQAKLVAQGMPGTAVYCIGTRQVNDFWAAALAGTGTMLPGLATLAEDGNSRRDGFVGSFWGSPVYTTSNFSLANTDADEVGACFIRGDEAANAESAAYGLMWKRPPRTKVSEEIEEDERRVVTTARYGVVERADESTVKIVTDKD